MDLVTARHRDAGIDLEADSLLRQVDHCAGGLLAHAVNLGLYPGLVPLDGAPGRSRHRNLSPDLMAVQSRIEG